MRHSEKIPRAFRAEDILKKLIEIDSTSSDSPELARDTRAASDFVGSYLAEKTGAQVHYTDSYEFPEGSGKYHKGMIAVWRPAQDTGKSPMAFSAHIDTVPALGSWKGHDPYTSQEDEDKITGRGALDMKGQVASLMATFKAKYDRGEFDTLDRPLVFMLSSCEEVGLKGAKGVCDLTREKVGVPEEVVIIEPTDGYIGIGCKGMRRTDITLTGDTSLKDCAHYTHYMTVEIGSSSGHSSLQAASPADPAMVATSILEYVRTLRKKGIKTEICAVDYGVAANVVGGSAKIVVGYEAPSNDPNGEALYENMRTHFENYEQIKANLILRFFTFAGNLSSRIKNEVRDMDMGTVRIHVDQDHSSAHESAPSYPITLRHLADGSTVSQSAVEHAVQVTDDIYMLHKQQRAGGRPEHYAIPLLGVTKLSVPMIKGDAARTTLSCDMRYPMEAEKGNRALRIDKVDALSDAIALKASGNSDIDAKVETTSDIPPYKTCAPSDKRLDPYLTIGEETGFTGYNSKASCAPYSSDGNVIAKEFPQALIVTMAQGGFRQMPHGEGEHLTKHQIATNRKVFEAIIDARALPGTEKQQPALSSP